MIGKTDTLPAAVPVSRILVTLLQRSTSQYSHPFPTVVVKNHAGDYNQFQHNCLHVRFLTSFRNVITTTAVCLFHRWIFSAFLRTVASEMICI
jgi:nitrite reductase/ring-hydroxylating ferredoxin subunit